MHVTVLQHDASHHILMGYGIIVRHTSISAYSHTHTNSPLYTTPWYIIRHWMLFFIYVHLQIHIYIGPFICRRMLLLHAHHTFALLAWGDTWYYRECYWVKVVSLVRSVHQGRVIRHSAVWYSTMQCSVAWHSTVQQSTIQSSIVHVWYIAVQCRTVRYI